MEPQVLLTKTTNSDKPVRANSRSEERGGIDQYDFNISFNINDRVYLGVTVGAYAICLLYTSRCV